jgi:hypothetical protein
MTEIATVKKRSLLDISNDYGRFFDLLESVELDEMSPEEDQQLTSFLMALDEERDKKLDNIGAFVKDLEARGKARTEIRKQMEKLEKADFNKAKYLKEFVLHFFQANGINDTIQTLRCKFRKQPNGGLMPLVLTESAVVEPHLLPERFQKVTITPDTDAIRAALDAGEELKGIAMFAERGEHLRIG